MMNDKIDALPAGRELDALVAERVMGLLVLPIPSDHPHTNYCLAEPKDALGDVTLLAYSADIAAAWEVVEKVTADGVWECSVTYEQGYATAYGVKGWTVEISRLDGDNRRQYQALSGLCGTAPLAICHAALKAVLGNPPEGQ
jgi:hypothetical protein